MRCGGEQRIPEGGGEKRLVCEMPEELFSSEELQSPACAPPEEAESPPMPPADAPFHFNPVMMSEGQRTFLDNPAVPIDQSIDIPHPDSDLLYTHILGALENATPKSTVERVVERPEGSPIVAPRDSHPYAVSGDRPILNAEVYRQRYERGLGGLGYLEGYLQQSTKGIAKTSDAQIDRLRAAVADYSAATEAVFNEGTEYGFTASHAHEFYMNQLHTYGRVFRWEDGFMDQVLREMGPEAFGTPEFFERVHGRMLEKMVDAKVFAEVYEAMGPEQYGTPEFHAEIERRMLASDSVNPEWKHYQRVRETRARTGDPLSRRVTLTGFNLGMNMTDVNKRDPSGGRTVADPIRDELRRRFNELFGRQVWTHGRDGTGIAAADSIAKLKNMTNLAMDIRHEEITRIVPKLHRAMLDYVHAFPGADLAGIPFPLAGHYAEMEVDFAKHPLRDRTTMAVRIIEELLAPLHVGEDIASKRNTGTWNVERGAVPRGEALFAINELFQLFQASSRRDDAYVAGKNGSPDATRDLLRSINRESHTFGLQRRHAREVNDRLERLVKAIEAYRENPTFDRQIALKRACKALKNYLRKPPEQIDPAKKSLRKRLVQDFERSRVNYRYVKLASGGFFIYKNEFLDEISARPFRNVKELAVVYFEGKKLGDFMKAINGKRGFGPQDPLFTDFFEKVRKHYRRAGLEVVGLGTPGGDEIPVIVRSIREGAGTIADRAGRATETILIDTAAPHKGFFFPISEKVPYPGGEFGGVRFAVKEGELCFVQPDGVAEELFRQRVEGIRENPAFQKLLAENFQAGEGFRVITPRDYAKGNTTRHAMWHLDSDPNAKLFLPKTVAGVGVERTTAEFGWQAAVVRVTDARDLSVVLNEIAPGEIARMKATGEDLRVIRENTLTTEQLMKGRLEHRLAVNGANFMIADGLARLFIGVAQAYFDEDPSLILEEVGLGIPLTYGGLVAGGHAGDWLYRTGVEAVSGNLVQRGPKGLRINPLAYRERYAGFKAMGGNLVATTMAVAVVDFFEDFKVDPVQLANSLAVLYSAQMITHALRATSALRKVKVGGPVHIFVEIMAIYGISKLEALAILEYEKMQRHDALASAMGEYDAAIEALGALGRRIDPEVEADAVSRLTYASAQLSEAHRSYMEILAFSETNDFLPVQRAHREIADAKEAVGRAKKLQGIPDGVPEGLKVFYCGGFIDGPPVFLNLSPSEVAGVKKARAQELEESKRVFDVSVDQANRSFRSGMRQHGEDYAGSDLHLPFADEREAFLEEQDLSPVPDAILMAPMGHVAARMMPLHTWLPPEERAEHLWARRYHSTLRDGPHEVALQSMLFFAERQVVLQQIARQRGLPAEALRPYAVQARVSQEESEEGID